jgi:hypothetical protein
MITEHIRDTRLENLQLVVTEHTTARRHGIDFDKTGVTVNICTYHPRIIKEAIRISKYPHSFNHEESLG